MESNIAESGLRDDVIANIRTGLKGRPLVFIGLMGAGKSCIGRMVAKALDLDFVDADREIEEAAGCSIADIFKLYGEEAFREGEERVIARLLDGEPLVLATGGGAFIREKTRELILEKSVSVWLRADLDLLLQRTSGRTHRPLLNNGDPRQILGDLIEARYPVYAGADIIFDCDESSKEETRDGVIALLGRSFDKDGNIIR
ncbi:shikimate kinase [Thalassospira sp. MBR-102]|jgi:shikimate kinase|uniref:Shikimate kinase n=2 Tax=Thalassospira xiamenensis TaxID=220697 RepID=A0ABR5Y321_9PROT|nr:MULTISPECIES: shikimate kinase [Thalassospira]MBL4841001.1 shikimate kinase [Thalassospira sp.]MBR9781880.1 shikimate kinase [Rhodospirillales bacterium]AJD50545.1 shikimate kinase [Thalassospira xiamenensis M-5 = DSM 17429]KZD04790.1 shikimate kinase [Thalassospira xiamenensis]KZD05566.1 shikimate kinase [Thalassospira xiamenensis]|tara:strand:+ start:15806 stop:16408 length:603 start_codon:yes stop_codon:yes gene_type:complete